MTFSPFSRRARTDTAQVRDRSVALVLFFLLTLVFAPVIGLHVALAAFNPAPSKSVGTIAQAPAPKGKGS